MYKQTARQTFEIHVMLQFPYIFHFVWFRLFFLILFHGRIFVRRFTDFCLVFRILEVLSTPSSMQQQQQRYNPYQSKSSSSTDTDGTIFNQAHCIVALQQVRQSTYLGSSFIAMLPGESSKAPSIKKGYPCGTQIVGTVDGYKTGLYDKKILISCLVNIS